MRKKILMMSAIGLVSAALASGAFASAGQYPKGDGDVANGQSIFEKGKGDVPACTSCHGEDGSGMTALGTPRIAGQFFTFLLKQLEDYASDKRMDTTMFIMNTNAKGLTPQDRRDVATFLAAKKIDFVPTSRKELEEAGHKVGATNFGKSLVELGSPEVSACKSCHGYAGRGAPPIYPIIGQQRYVYLVAQLKKWKDGSRTNDSMGQMQAIARKLSDEDILNAAAYLSSSTPYSMGNTRTPYDH